MADDSPLILAFGDSLVAGYRLGPKEGFAPQLEEALRQRGLEARVVNAGVSGNTAGAARARLARVLEAQPERPDLAVVALGGNDMLRGVPARQTREDMDSILETLRDRGIRTVVAGMLAPPFLGVRYTREFNAIFPELARNYGARLYPFFLAGVAGNPRLNLPDRVHPNAGGVARMVSGILPSVVEALSRPAISHDRS